jgi:lycopene cyclase domain-containing protein
MEYFVILMILLVSGVIIQRKNHIQLYKSRKEQLIVVLVFFVIGVLWNHYAIFRGHWTFPGPGMIGFNIGLMPIEEYLFILIVPFWIITVYKVLTNKIK